MRDLLVTAIVFGLIPVILKRPWIGILAWSWLSYMNPHRLTWGFAYSMPFAQMVALATFMSLLFNQEKKSLPMNGTTVLWVVFVLWMGLTSLTAIYPDAALGYYVRVLKIQVIAFLTVMLVRDKYRLNCLIWVVTLSIGFFSIKGGIFTLMTGGQYRVRGPSDSMIGENNAMGLAALMIIPFFFYLRSVATNLWLKRGLLGGLVLSVISALGSQSRGALISMCVLGVYFWWQSKNKLVSAMVLVILAGVGLTVMPASWHERMSTITEFSEDSSAMSRIYAWKYSINIANDRLLGGGYNSWSKSTYAIYQPEAIGVFVAHSIYFNVLADHGWLGLMLFLAIFFMTWRNLSISDRLCRGSPEDSDLSTLARMLKVSLVAYASGGAFLSLSYYDLPWHIVAFGVILRNLANSTITYGSASLVVPASNRPARRLVRRETS